ncbi:amidohydrolase [Streptomyces sp. adm13(2018)]|uniref:amidohydrolase n=1 Tax=Streptomyces sp. adm13(2018) TaxID=2479007 RepID=UPI0011CE35AE|nr:amidohydrolase [Streptomyces sp. adm13(2018)]TXS21941.1 amidohydrolase [Streptomyces sp. adm13(2018)]
MSNAGSTPGTAPGSAVFARLPDLREGLADLYRDLHTHPELSFAETRTAGLIAERLRALGLDVTTGVGRTGVVGVLANGDGPHVLLRADFDALPVTEQTGLPYASGTDGVMHACGHDMHVACLLGALDLLAGGRAYWTGTVTAVFQPAEETGAGARAMVDDGLFDRTGKPDVVLGQHVGPFPAGSLGCHAGPALAATDALKVTLHGKGAHGSRPEAAIDPVVMAASTVMRLQTVVSREIAGSDTAVVTVGVLNAGTTQNVIPDTAELKLNIRTYTEEVRKTVLAAVRRIIEGEAAAAGATRTPDIEPIETFAVLVNDDDAMDRTATAFREHFGTERVFDPGPATGSEDCGTFATASGAPICYWFFGGIDPDTFAKAEAAGTTARDIPSNHSPHFAPVVEPTLSTGVEAMTTAALTWLSPDPENRR